MSYPLIVLLGSLLSSPAHADDPFAWFQPSPEEQLAEDTTVIEVGKGAIFVPCMTTPSAEPPVILVDGDEVRDIPTGERVLVEPGSYTVIVSPGSPGQGVSQSILVREGETTLVPVNWGALQIQVTDDRRVPFRGQYDLIAAGTRETIGTGFGADTFQGEKLMTWLLAPGVYRIVRPGANYRQLRNFATVYVPEGGLVRYRLVVNPTTGEFLGAGMLLPGEFGAGLDADRRWAQTLVIGLDGSYVQSLNRVGITNQTVLSGNLFIDHQILYRRDKDQLTALLQGEAGATSVRPQAGVRLPVLKTRDRLQADLLYSRYSRENFGPYVRAGAETRVFPTDVISPEDTTYTITYLDGTIDARTLPANSTLRVANAWSPTVVREGAGLNYRALNRRWLTFNLRLGLGMRQNFFGGALILDDNRATPEVEYSEVGNFYQEGVEATVVLTARLPGWAVYATDLELFADVDDFRRPSLEWRNTFTIRLSRIMSVNYFANLDYLPQVVDNVQLEHSVVLRASWTLL